MAPREEVDAELARRVQRRLLRLAGDERVETPLQAAVDDGRLVPPEEAVVHGAELRTGRSCALEQRTRRRDTAREPRHLVGADDLQSRPAELGERRDVEQFVGKAD